MKKILFTALTILSLSLSAQPLMADSTSSSDASANVDAAGSKSAAYVETTAIGAKLEVTFEPTNIPDALPIPHEISYPPGVNMPYTPDVPQAANVQKVETLLFYQDTFTVAELETMLNKSPRKVKVTPKKLNPRADLTDTVTIYVSAQNKQKIAGAKLTGYVNAEGDDEEVQTMEVLGGVGLAAHAMGANFVHITGEGAERLIHSLGWGVGFAYSRATVANNGENGVGSGGTGVSSATGGFLHLPFLQSSALRVE